MRNNKLNNMDLKVFCYTILSFLICNPKWKYNKNHLRLEKIVERFYHLDFIKQKVQLKERWLSKSSFDSFFMKKISSKYIVIKLTMGEDYFMKHYSHKSETYIKLFF